MKRKSARKIQPSEAIHFFPGELLGSAISQYATYWETSRGDAVKRLVIAALNLADTDSRRTAHQRKSAKSVSPTAPIHFRPTHQLGAAIADHAVRWRISRGAATKRLVALSANGLDVEFHDVADDLVRYLGVANRFENACSCIRVRIAQTEAELACSAPAGQTKSERLETAKSLVDSFRSTTAIEEEAERQRAKIYLHNGELLQESEEQQRVRIYLTD